MPVMHHRHRWRLKVLKTKDDDAFNPDDSRTDPRDRERYHRAECVRGTVESECACAAIAPVPFGVGERMTYKVHLGVLGDVGTGFLQVVDLDTINGHPSYELRFVVRGGIPFARVDDDYKSWLDVGTLFSRRFKQDQNEVRYERHRTLDFLSGRKALEANRSGLARRRVR
jgi:hypothetical protein